jgi:hypothetical protein
MIPSEPTRVRGLLLAAASLLMVAALCLPPANRAWVGEVLHDYSQLGRQVRAPGVEERMRSRYGRNYTVLEGLELRLRPGDVLLLPPPDYVRLRFDAVFWNWAEPRFFYYMLGRRPTVTIDGPRAGEATCTVLIDDQGRPSFTPIDGPADLTRARAAFGR